MDSFQMSWAEFKALIDLWNIKNLVRFTAKANGGYRVVWLQLDGCTFQVLNLADPTDVATFEAGYQPNATTTWTSGKSVLRKDLADQFTAAANSTTSHDLKLTANTWVWGGDMVVQGASPVDGDWGELQVVDVDGIMYPAGTVLRTIIPKKYISGARIFTTSSPNGQPSLVVSGLYLRFSYTEVNSFSKVIDINLIAMS
jgi:hypothetical protein